MIKSTSTGGSPAGNPKPKISVANPIPETVPNPIPPRRDPAKMQAKTIANCNRKSDIELSLVAYDISKRLYGFAAPANVPNHTKEIAAC
jgi:hypothetical protein